MPNNIYSMPYPNTSCLDRFLHISIQMVSSFSRVVNLFYIQVGEFRQNPVCNLVVMSLNFIWVFLLNEIDPYSFRPFFFQNLSQYFLILFILQELKSEKDKTSR